MTVKAVLDLGCKLEEWLFQTRTPAKEIAFWAGSITALIVFTIRLYQTYTIDFNGERLYKNDIVKDHEYREVALVLGVCSLVYLIDTAILAYKKAAHYVDCLTYLNEAVFWALITAYGFLFDGSLPCESGKNIFPCVFQTEVRLGRWPYIWIIPMIKLIVDSSLLMYFRFWQKRLISYSHGQSIAGILLDVQYLLVTLWVSDNFGGADTKSIITRREIYDAKLIFVILFKGSMAMPIFIIFCGMLANFEFRRGRKAKALTWVVGALGAAVVFIFAFFLDATLGSLTAHYLEVCRALCIVLICFSGIYGISNIYFKLKTGYAPYILYFTLKAYPAIEKSPMLVTSQPICRPPEAATSVAQANAQPPVPSPPSDSQAPVVNQQGIRAPSANQPAPGASA